MRSGLPAPAVLSARRSRPIQTSTVRSSIGGSCLPKDIRALNYKARSLDLEMPIIGNILAANQLQIERGLNMILAKGNKKIAVLGFSFKSGTDDLRESPLVELVERLIGRCLRSSRATPTRFRSSPSWETRACIPGKFPAG